MIDGTYDVAMDTPKHHKRGLLHLKGEGGIATASLELSEEEPMVFSGPVIDKDFAFQGDAVFPGLGDLNYTAKGNVWGNSVTISFETDSGKVEVFGTRLSTQAGDMKSSHEYMLSGGQGEFKAEDNTMYSGLYGDGG